MQTNHDHWLVDPVPAADGGFGSDRAGPAMERMGLARPGVIAPVSAEDPEGALRDYRESMSAETMWGVIGSMPNFTFTGKTLLSAVMIPATGLCDVRYQVRIPSTTTTSPYIHPEYPEGQLDRSCVSVFSPLVFDGSDSGSGPC